MPSPSTQDAGRPASSAAEAAPTAARPEQFCPTCGAKRTRPDSTLCAYCATPFDLVRRPQAGADGSAGGKPPHRERLERMKDHAGFAEAWAWTPLESREYEAAERAHRRGTALAVLGAVLLGAGIAAGLFAWLAAPAVLSIGIGIAWIARGRAERTKILKLPLLKRPAIVLDRRSETSLGYWSGKTVYYFELEFADGSGGEFRWPGRGIDHAPLAKGATGLAFTRGDTLLGFRPLRV